MSAIYASHFGIFEVGMFEYDSGLALVHLVRVAHRLSRDAPGSTQTTNRCSGS